MNINRVTLAGFAGKDARSSSTLNGRSITKLSIATTSALITVRDLLMVMPPRERDAHSTKRPSQYAAQAD